MEDQATFDAAAKTDEGFEGFSATPYQDVGKVWTIGFGSIRDASGAPVTQHTPSVTREQAQALLERDMRAAFATVQGDVKVPLTDDQEAALADFIYNVGAGNFASSTLLRDLNAGNSEAAAQQFLVWDKVKGVVFAGLLRRRQAEQALFDTPTPSAPAAAPVEATPAPAAPNEGSWLIRLLQTILR